MIYKSSIVEVLSVNILKVTERYILGDVQKFHFIRKAPRLKWAKRERTKF